MAIQITNQSVTGHYGETLTELYVRVEPRLDKTGDKVVYELYFYKDKASFLAGSNPIKSNERYSIEYQVTNDGFVLYGLHYLLVQHLLTLTVHDNESNGPVPVYEETDLTIVDVDVPS